MLLFINNLVNVDDQDFRSLNATNKVESFLEAFLLIIDDDNTLADYDEGMEESKRISSKTEYFIYETDIDHSQYARTIKSTGYAFNNNLTGLYKALPDTPPPQSELS